MNYDTFQDLNKRYPSGIGCPICHLNHGKFSELLADEKNRVAKCSEHGVIVADCDWIIAKKFICKN